VHVELLPIAVVIPTRNRVLALRRALESLADQSAHPAELIVIDASDDTSTQALCMDQSIARLASKVLWQVADVRGAADQRNQGVGACSQPVIGFMDDDILFQPHCFARLWSALQSDPRLGGVNAMTKDPGFGVSQFMENARYQHALETELARTIASLQNVQGARVHLAMARQSAFVSDRRPGSASVFLQLKAGRRLDEEQVQAIANLVASSIPEMSAAQVTVVDQAGRLLSSPDSNSDVGQRDKMFEFAHRLEESYSNRIQEMITPLVGPGRVRAQVVA